ncbi:hypothetical protein V6N12_030503 [Hibiscus sabdariffa]|uniref:Uncharacterized protein n=1 Tax=Hibiscus sabdariffa TaxID=183260 RepID=A0ABR2BBE2_9ROSI
MVELEGKFELLIKKSMVELEESEISFPVRPSIIGCKWKGGEGSLEFELSFGDWFPAKVWRKAIKSLPLATSPIDSFECCLCLSFDLGAFTDWVLFWRLLPIDNHHPQSSISIPGNFESLLLRRARVLPWKNGHLQKKGIKEEHSKSSLGGPKSSCGSGVEKSLERTKSR